MKNSYRIGPYRSFVEFQWALAFEKLGIDFIYEPQEFRITNPNYLPDFKIKKYGILHLVDDSSRYEDFPICEVKQRATKEEIEKCRSLSCIFNTVPVIILEKYPSINRVYKGFKNGELKHFVFGGRSFRETSFTETPKKFSEREKCFYVDDDDVMRIIHEIKEGESIQSIRKVLNKPFKDGWRDWTDVNV